MKKKLLMIWLSVFLTTMLAFACTGDDDDDNDDAAADDDSADDDSADDDSADDDTTGDDDANDDDSADDDTTDDDADDDDDLTDYTREPVAVLTADARFVEIGDEVSFTGDGSSDPNGESLSFLLDFGDGDSIASANATHAYAAGGTFRARLTTTNETGYSDESEVLVTVGTPTTNNGSLDVIDFRPNHYNPIIIEPGDKPKHGGVIYGFFIAPDNAAPDTIKVNGNVYEPQTDGLQWCEVVPAQLLAGEIGIVRCHSYDNAFDAGDTVELEVLQGAVSLWQKTAPLPAPTLTPGYITANVQDDEILLHLRNDDDAPWTITGLKVNGADVSDFITVAQPTLAPGETSV
ncbi:MAG TPA: PKD domain-containing protein, partial [bacterium]|nr:PKD domain-containing protein [bacterium]